MTDFLDDILRRFRPPSESDSEEEDDDLLDEIIPEQVEEVHIAEGPIDDEGLPPLEDLDRSATEIVRLPAGSAGGRRRGGVEGETPTENITLSLEELVREINVLRGEIRSRDKDLGEREESVTDLQTQYNELVEERKRYQEKASHLELQVDSYITKIETAETDSKKLSARLKVSEEKQAESARLLVEAQKDLDSASQRFRDTDKPTEVLLREKAEFQQKSNQMELQLNSLISQLDESQEKAAEARSEVEQLRKERDRLMTRMREVKATGAEESPLGDQPSTRRPDEEVRALEEKLSAILSGEGTPSSGSAVGAGPEVAGRTDSASPESDGADAWTPDDDTGRLADLARPRERDETERIGKSSLSFHLHPSSGHLGDSVVEKRILSENRATLEMILKGGAISPLGLGSLVADLDKALQEGQVSAFASTNGQSGEALRRLYFSAKLSMALARTLGYEPLEVRKVGICALLVIGNGEHSPDIVKEEFTKIIAVAGTYGDLVTRRPAMLPGEAIGKLVAYVDEGKLDKEYVRSFLEMASLFPPGSWVQLSSGEIGMVLMSNPSDARRPVVRLHFGRGGQPMPSPQKVNLLEMPQVSISRPVAAPPPDSIPNA